MGINWVFFWALHDRLVEKGQLHTTQALTSELQLLLVLNWLHEMPKLSMLGLKFNIAKSVISTTINGLIYDLCEVLAELAPILLPECWTRHKFEGVVGAVDCTSHYRCRVHPGQALYYCGDKRGHFLMAQVCTFFPLIILFSHSQYYYFLISSLIIIYYYFYFSFVSFSHSHRCCAHWTAVTSMR